MRKDVFASLCNTSLPWGGIEYYALDNSGCLQQQLESFMANDGSLNVGDNLADRYEVLSLIAEGDRRRTYLAKDSKLDDVVALSVVRPECIDLDPEGVEREAKVLRAIGSHNHIVSVFDFVVEGPVQFVVFEYLSGGTLANRLAKEGPLSQDSLLRFGRQICKGLAHLHAAGLIHRDVAAKNVLLDGEGKAHLGDFDSAVRIEDADSHDRPATPNRYAPPEETNRRTVDYRSDLYSFGCLLYVLATGTGNVGSVDDLRAKRSDLPPSLVDLIATLIARSPDDRPRDAHSVLLRLDAIQKDLPSMAMARARLPYPVARAARAVEIARERRDQYEELLAAGETVAITLGASIVAALQDQVREMGAFRAFTEALCDRGVTQGHWISIIGETFSFLHGRREPLHGLVDALKPERKGAGLVPDLMSIVEERNRWAHGSKPRSPTELDERSANLLGSLDRILARMAFLGDAPWYVTEAISYLSKHRHFLVRATVAMGDHPDFEYTEFESPTPLADNTVYLMAAAGPVELSPFVVNRYCPTCSRQELLYTARLDNRDAVVLKSFATGHVVLDSELAEDVRAIVSVAS